MEQALKEILEHRIIASDLVMLYDDAHGLWGGTRIEIDGSGRAERREYARGRASPARFETEISPTQLLELVGLLIELEAWDQKTLECPAIPDEITATLNLSTAAHSSRIWEWFDELAQNRRLIQIKARMIELTTPDS